MIRLPPRSTQSRSSAASDVYKRQGKLRVERFESRERVVGDIEEEELRRLGRGLDIANDHLAIAGELQIVRIVLDRNMNGADSAPGVACLHKRLNAGYIS